MQVANASGHGHQAARLNRLVQLALITGLSLSMLLMVAGRFCSSSTILGPALPNLA